MRIYLASKTKHAQRWKDLRAQGLSVVASWIDEAGQGESSDVGELWRRNIVEASTASALIHYVEPGETPKGALAEIGAALAGGVPVFWVGPTDGQTIVEHPGVRVVETLSEAVTWATAVGWLA